MEIRETQDGILIETELFDDYGGWSADTQFLDTVGSAYLMAHGMGRTVVDARAAFELAQGGTYHVWARTKDWVPSHHPGTFQVGVNGLLLPTVLGATGKCWAWEYAGQLELAASAVEVSLHDLTGFDGRCDALFLTLGDDAPAEGDGPVDAAWRRAMKGIPDEPDDKGAFDVVVCGGGLPGCAAALAAAGNGCKVALVHDRPVFGGNASREVGLGARGYFDAWVEKLCERQADGNLAATAMVEAEPNISVFLNEHVTGARMVDGVIATVEAVNALTGALSVFAGKEFIDCTGRAVLGVLSGARTKTGCEARSEFDESLAPEEASGLHHGNTVLYHVREAAGPVAFPDVPWAKEVARDFAELGGQMGALGEDNQPGPAADDKHAMGSAVNKLKLGPKVIGSVKKNHMFPPEEIMNFLPGTHYWEYGQDMDMEANEEEIRDHLMRALYGTLANVRSAQPKKYAGLEFEWMHIVPARGEYRRYVGDYAMTEGDVREHRLFDDSIVFNDQAFCIHYGGHEKYDFRLKSWVWDMRDQKPYALPFRCLYSADVPNLLCAGKHISTTRVVGTNVKMMANGAQHGIAAGCAAALCAEKGWTPRQIAAEHMPELKAAVSAYTDVPED